MGRRTGLPGLWVLASVTVGGGLGGIVGMVLSVPTATFLYVLLGRGVARREKDFEAQEKAEKPAGYQRKMKNAGQKGKSGI